MSREKITVVLLPGLNGTAGLFDRLVKSVTAEFSTICISYPTHELKTYAELTSLVLKRLTQIHGKYILVGESFSGPVSVFVSHSSPSGLLGTILVATFVTPPNLRIARFLPWELGFIAAKPLYYFRRILGKKENNSLLKDTSVELSKVSPRVLAFRMRQIFSLDAEKELSESEVPFIYFRGNHDYVVPSWSVQKILAIKPNMKVITFNTQHFLLQSAPDQAWDAISAFASDLLV